jgi:hypothetical protein
MVFMEKKICPETGGKFFCYEHNVNRFYLGKKKLQDGDVPEVFSQCGKDACR